MNIILNFIMKNEEKVLERMLSSVINIINGAVCIDTGSSDESKKIVKEFFEKHNKPCAIYDHPFMDFEDARNFALNKLKQSYTNDSDFGFWIDCDESLIIKNVFDLNKFKAELSNFDLGTTIVNSGSSRFARRNFFRILKSFRWEGKVHEILLCDEEIKINNFTDIEILVKQDGHSWSEGIQKKYFKHAEILELEVSKTNRPRDIFYTAQSYKDAGENEKAIEWYRKRVERVDGFYEERYYSQFMIGLLYDRIKKPFQETIFEYLKCSQLDTLRAEHLLNVIIIMILNGFSRTALVLCEDAVKKYHGKNPYPERLLFIDEETYSKKIKDVHEALIFNLK